MYPVLFRLPLPGGHWLPVPAYGAFLVLGVILAAFVAGRRTERLGLDRNAVLNLGWLSVVCGTLAAHSLHVCLNWRRYGSWGLLAFPRGLVFYGGLAGGILAVAWYARRRRVQPADLLDVIAPVATLGLAVTRFGCFLNGCCFGRPSNLPWAVRFPPGSPAQALHSSLGFVGSGAPSLAVHPVQLYEMIAALPMFALLWALYPRRRFAGETTFLFLALYGAWRFAVEFLRADSGGFARWLSLAILGVSAAVLLQPKRLQRMPRA